MILQRIDRPDGDAGFTLIEVLVAFSIFAIVATAATFAIVTGVKTNNTTNDRVAAAQIAQQEIDRTRAMPRTALPSMVPTSTVTRGSKNYTVERTVSYAPAGATACPAPSAAPTDTAVHKAQVTVRVRIPGAGQRTVRIDSVLAC